jgi:hypothetical protein
LAALKSLRRGENEKTAGADGQWFGYHRKTLHRTFSHKFNDFAIEFYTFVADNYAPFYNLVKEATDRDTSKVLAMEATNDDTIASLKGLMKDLEKQKRDAQALLYDIEEDNEERAELETELVKFEKWVATVQPLLTNPSYNPPTKKSVLLCIF